MADLSQFPPSSIENIAAYAQQAKMMDGEYSTNLKAVIAASLEQQKQVEIHNAAALVQQQVQPTVDKATEATHEIFTPHKNVIPGELEDLPWPKSHKSWMTKYCRHGAQGLTQDDLNKIRKKYPAMTTDPSPSELDAKVMYQLICMGYTEKAVLNFWQRPDVALYRPDKMMKNPNYLVMSYANMLKEAQDTQTKVKKKVDATMNGQIFVHNNTMYIGTRDEPKPLITADIRLLEVYQNLDAMKPQDREYWKCKVLMSNGTAQIKPVDQLFPRKAFNSVNDFKEFCHGSLFCLAQYNREMAMISQYLWSMSKDVKHHDFRTKMCYSNKTFIYPRMTIHADKIVKSNKFEKLPLLQEKFPWHETFVSEKPDVNQAKEIIRDHWYKLQTCHLPQLVCSLVGVIGAIAAREIIEAHKLSSNVYIPIVNIRGRSHSGKTETTKLLLKLAGVSKPNQLLTGLTSTKFALSRLPEFIQFVPIPIDEFKENEHNHRKIEEIRSLIRESFTGQISHKGRRDLSVSSQLVKSNFIVLGESILAREGDVSEQTRNVSIITDGFTSPDPATFATLERIPFEILGPLFHQWLLNQEPGDLLEKLISKKQEITTNLHAKLQNEKSRITNNFATIVWGYQLYSDFIQAMVPGTTSLFDTHNYWEFLIEESIGNIEDENNLIHYTHEGVEHSVMRDEALDFLNVLYTIHQSKFKPFTEALDRGVTILDIDENKGSLFIHLTNAFNIYREYCQHYRYPMANLQMLRQRFSGAIKRNEPWIKNRSVVRNIKLSNGTWSRFKAVELNFTVLLKMQIWELYEINESNNKSSKEIVNVF